jgi:hypothetical protein
VTNRPSSEPRPRCSSTGLDLDEPALGTASVVREWLLLEHPGAWASTALQSSKLPARVRTELARRANRTRVRVVLVRRTGRTAPEQPLACFAATTGPRGSWLGRVHLDRAEDVLDVDLAAIATSAHAGFEQVDHQLLCICTHGSHDPCCAERGRPVAAALAARFPAETWEISHIGGDRFAGNVVCLPAGDYLGRLSADTAVPVLEAYAGGHYVLPHLRGRAGFAPVVQAAEILVRERLGVTARHAVRVVDARREDPFADVRLVIDGHGELVARMHIGAGPERTLTCHAVRTSAPPTFELLELSAATSPGR